MDASVIEHYTSRVAPRAPVSQESTEAAEDYGAFGLLRGVRERALMLELRMKDGSSTAFSYAYLVKATYEPSEGITLHFGGSTVTIVGTHLGKEVLSGLTVFGALLRQRVPWLQEADQAASLQAEKASIIIDEIRIEPRS